MFALSQIYGIPIAALAERFELDLRRETERTPIDARSAAELLERLDRPVAAAGHAKVHTPDLPAHLARSWRSFNTPEELEEL